MKILYISAVYVLMIHAAVFGQACGGYVGQKINVYTVVSGDPDLYLYHWNSQNGVYDCSLPLSVCDESRTPLDTVVYTQPGEYTPAIRVCKCVRDNGNRNSLGHIDCTPPMIEHCIERSLSDSGGCPIVIVDNLKLYDFSAQCPLGGDCSFDPGQEIKFSVVQTGAVEFRYQWEGVGTAVEISNIAIPSHRYMTKGRFLPVLEICNKRGQCESMGSQELTIGDPGPPDAPPSLPYITHCLTLPFQASVEDPQRVLTRKLSHPSGIRIDVLVKRQNVLASVRDLVGVVGREFGKKYKWIGRLQIRADKADGSLSRLVLIPEGGKGIKSNPFSMPRGFNNLSIVFDKGGSRLKVSYGTVEIEAAGLNTLQAFAGGEVVIVLGGTNPAIGWEYKPMCIEIE